jgi:sulfhydrogenase subunit delta
MAATNPRPRLAVFKFASCDGCQLQLIDIMDEMQLLRRMLDRVEIAYFLEATSEIQEGPYDIGIVEGSISTAQQRERIREVREQCRFLVTIGACATSGGIQALRNWRDDEEIMRAVYAKPEFIDTLKHSTAIADHVPVDFELRGCPINKVQLQEVLTAFLNGKAPAIPTYSVCIECKRRGNICVTVARGEPCLGPVTQAGCGAICPAYDRGCYGCYGAMEQPNMRAQTNMMRALGLSTRQIGHAFRSYAHATEFDEVAGEMLDGGAGDPGP